jgi:hypothetical protein
MSARSGFFAGWDGLGFEEQNSGGDQVDRRPVPARVRDFLRGQPGRIYCDACIQALLGLKWRQQAQLITATLAVTSEFDRGRGVCSNCNQTKYGISARQIRRDER